VTSTMPSFSVHVQPGCDTTVLTVDGELDLATAPQLLEQSVHWLVLGSGDLHVDLSGVTFADSSAVEVLLEVDERARSCGAQLRLRDPSRALLRILHLTGAAPRFEHVSSLDTHARSA
jgi:anti-anti-sigma factor